MSFLSNVIKENPIKQEDLAEGVTLEQVPKLDPAPTPMVEAPSPATPPAPVAQPLPAPVAKEASTEPLELVKAPEIKAPEAIKVEPAKETLLTEDKKQEESISAPASTIDAPDDEIAEEPKTIKSAKKLFAKYHREHKELREAREKTAAFEVKEKTLQDQIAALEAKPVSKETDEKIAALEAKLTAAESKTTAAEQKERALSEREANLERRDIAYKVTSSKAYQDYVIKPTNDILTEIKRISIFEAEKMGEPENASRIENALAEALQAATPEDRHRALVNATEGMTQFSVSRMADVLRINDITLNNYQKLMSNSEKTRQQLESEEEHNKAKVKTERSGQFAKTIQDTRANFQKTYPIITPEKIGSYASLLAESDTYVKSFEGRSLTPEEAANAVAGNAFHHTLFQIAKQELAHSVKREEVLVKELADAKARLSTFDKEVGAQKAAQDKAEIDRKAKEQAIREVEPGFTGSSSNGQSVRHNSFVDAVMHSR